MAIEESSNKHMCCGKYMAYSARFSYPLAKDDYELFICMECGREEDVISKTREYIARLKQHKEKAATS